MLLPLKSCAFSTRNNQFRRPKEVRLCKRPNILWWTFAFRTSVAAVSCAGKRAILVLIFSLIIAGTVTAFEEKERAFLKEMGLTDQEITELIEINDNTQKTVQQAQAEINILRAQLEKHLISDQPNIKTAEKLLRSAMEWELKIRLAHIKRELDTRRLLGDKKWAELTRAIKVRAARRRQQALSKEPPREKMGRPGN